MEKRDIKGRFLKGRKLTHEEKQIQSELTKKSWSKRTAFHGMYKTKIYNSWRSMKNRCDGTSSKECNSKYYDKGITYCDEWKDFKNFYKDMHATHKDGLQLDRIDNSKGYSKQNCRWVTNKENCNNKSNTLRLEYQGMIKTLEEWSIELNRTYASVRCMYYKRYIKGLCTIDQLLTKKIIPLA